MSSVSLFGWWSKKDGFAGGVKAGGYIGSPGVGGLFEYYIPIYDIKHKHCFPTPLHLLQPLIPHT